MHNVKMLKLVTGEEIVCDFVKRENGVYCVKLPFAAVPMLKENSMNDITIRFMPFSVAAINPADDEVFEINENLVVMCHSAPKTIENTYISKISGLTIPAPDVTNKSLIVD